MRHPQKRPPWGYRKAKKKVEKIVPWGSILATFYRGPGVILKDVKNKGYSGCIMSMMEIWGRGIQLPSFFVDSKQGSPGDTAKKNGGRGICQGQGDGHRSGSLHGTETEKHVLFVIFADSKLIIACLRLQRLMLGNLIM